MSNRNIPSEEDFKRAEAADAQRHRGLNEVRERIMNLYGKRGLHEFFMFYSPKTETFGAYVFYRKNSQIPEAVESGLSSEIEDAVFEELVRVGRGSRSTLKVNIEFDSHQNVEENFEGDYFQRLR